MNKKRNERTASERRRNRKPRHGYEYQISREQYNELIAKGGCAGILGVMAYLNQTRGLMREIVWLTIVD